MCLLASQRFLLTLFFSLCLDFRFSLERLSLRWAETGWLVLVKRPLTRWLRPPMIPRHLSNPHLQSCWEESQETTCPLEASRRLEEPTVTIIITEIKILEPPSWKGPSTLAPKLFLDFCLHRGRRERFKDSSRPLLVLEHQAQHQS